MSVLPETQPLGRPMPCLLTGAAMLAIPTILELLAPPPTSARDAGVGLAVTLILVVGAASVALTTLRPGAGLMAALAVLCTALALALVPPEPIWDGMTGFACLIFLLAVRLHRQQDSADFGEWLGRHRPMLVGAAVTTPAAIAAAEVPAEWSLLAAGVAGLVSAAICVLLLMG
ncbi:MAG TPA: hypothetical protein VGH89_04605 [Pseudonocardia sp.]|jgi:hypothetical protein